MSNPLSLRSTYTGHPRDARLKVETPRFIGSGMSRDDVAVEVVGRDGNGASRVMVNGPTLRDHLIERFPIEPLAVERGIFEERKPAAPTRFAVGDRVRIANEAGSRVGKVGDTGTVMARGLPGTAHDGCLLTVDLDNGTTTRLFESRFEKVGAPKFKVGDYVRMVEPYSRFDERGDVWLVTGLKTILGEEYVVGTRLRDGSKSLDRKAFRFEKTEKPSTFKVGDVAVRTGAHLANGGINYHDREIKPGQRVKINKAASGDGEWWVTVLGGDRFRESVIHEDGLTLYTEPDAEGAVVYVTGDSQGWHHAFKAGDEVKVLRRFWGPDRGYTPGYGYTVIATANGARRWDVAEADLDVEKPFEPIPVGTIVRIVNEGGASVEAYAPRHYFPIGSLVTVERPASREGDSYTLRGVIGGDHIGRGTVGPQFVKAASFEVVK